MLEKIEIIDRDYTQPLSEILDLQEVHEEAFISIAKRPMSYRKHVVKGIKNSQGSWLRIFTPFVGDRYVEYLDMLGSLQRAPTSLLAVTSCFPDCVNARHSFKYGLWVDTNALVVCSFIQEIMDDFREKLLDEFGSF